MRTAGLVWPRGGRRADPPDLRAVRGTDLSARSGGVIVAVNGRRPRAVQVLARYHEPRLASAAFAGTSLVTGGTDPARRNVTTPLTRALAGGTGLPRLDTSRLRATWLADCAARIGLATFMHAAGITCSQRLGDLLATLEPGSETEAIALPGRQGDIKTTRAAPADSEVRPGPRPLTLRPHQPKTAEAEPEALSTSSLPTMSW